MTGAREAFEGVRPLAAVQSQAAAATDGHPIADYAAIGDTHSGALVAIDGG